MIATATINPAEIVRGLSLFCDGVTEIRLLGCQGSYGRPYTVSGYFDPDHFRDAAEQIVTLDRELRPSGCYFIFNEIHAGCHARAYNRFARHPSNTTTDAEILRRRWLFIDIDPPRPSGVSASSVEKESAIEDRELVFDELKEFAEPIVCDSGNGWHLYIPIDEPNTEGAKAQVETLLKNLHCVSPLVDVTTSNAARLTKLYGTTGRKGDSTPARPHRQAEILYTPDYLTDGWNLS